MSPLTAKAQRRKERHAKKCKHAAKSDAAESGILRVRFISVLLSSALPLRLRAFAVKK
jgi:hypothetical protein